MPPAQAPSQPRAGSTRLEPRHGARRTVVIRGQAVAPPPVSDGAYASVPARRRPPRRASERIVGTRPDRVAMWAVLMGVFLIAVAVLTGA